MKLLGIDTGGTFTDFVYYTGSKIITHKVLSTPDNPEVAILQGIEELGLLLAGIRTIHGSTVATNVLLERKGASTVFITNRGMRDILTIGRQTRSELYNLLPQPVPPPVEEKYCLETGGRLSAGGEILEELTRDDLRDIQHSIRQLDPESVAVNLLYSYLDNKFEEMIAAALPGNLFVSLSSRVLPEYREYERGISTWLNAYVGPRVQGYLSRLSEKLDQANLSIVRSSGDTCNAEQAGREAVNLLLSGPAAGLSGAKFIGSSIGRSKLMTFDMGGTSTDVSLIDNEIKLHNQGKIASFPVGVPMVDLHSIGAGGGSIAYVDQGGGLQVGPESAGAKPGPVCYGMGGKLPTVTDANLVLGHLPHAAHLGATIKPDLELATTALLRLAEQLNLGSAEEAALGVISVANENMTQALKYISVERGYDPREYTLTAFGGAGGMHICALADALEISSAIVPVHAGVLSALGMLAAPAGRQLSRTIGLPQYQCSDVMINEVLADLRKLGLKALTEQGLDKDNTEENPSLDICYRGQAFSFNIPWSNLKSVCRDFQHTHEQRFGHRLTADIEVVNVRLGIRAAVSGPALPEISRDIEAETAYTSVYGCANPVPVYKRTTLNSTMNVTGPSLIIDENSTTYIEQGWSCKADIFGNLILESVRDNKD